MSKNSSRHDKLVSKVEQLLKERGYKTTTHKEYKNKNGDGEIDLYAQKDGYTLVFEMKCSLRPKNWDYAIKQLARADHNYFHDKGRIFNFMVHYNGGRGDDYSIHWVRNPDDRHPFWESI